MATPVQSLPEVDLCLVGESKEFSSGRTFSRALSDNELSYFLPSREDGVNDVICYVGFRAARTLVTRDRVATAWATLRYRHVLLASMVSMEDGNYDSASFRYTPPESFEAAIAEAKASSELRDIERKDDIFESFLNGPRMLSNSRMSFLIISLEPGGEFTNPDEAQFNVVFAAAHHLSDGANVIAVINDFTKLIALDDNELRRKLEVELAEGGERALDVDKWIPVPTEARLPSPKSKLHSAMVRVDYGLRQDHLIGGHSFPRSKGTMPRRSIGTTIVYDENKSKLILKKCKANGVTPSAALFAICNFAWIRSMGTDKSFERAMPMMMYSAMGLRSYLNPFPTTSSSYMFLCLGYFNVILPSFLPSSADSHKIYWHRAKQAKLQTIEVAKSKLLGHRQRQMTRERCERAKHWARKDDEASSTRPESSPAVIDAGTARPPTVKTPSTALLGLSFLGNLDAVFTPPPAIKLCGFGGGTRQRQGGMLIRSWTFGGKMTIHIGYDVNGFREGVVEGFWAEVSRAIDEFVLEV